MGNKEKLSTPERRAKTPTSGPPLHIRIQYKLNLCRRQIHRMLVKMLHRAAPPRIEYSEVIGSGAEGVVMRTRVKPSDQDTSKLQKILFEQGHKLLGLEHFLTGFMTKITNKDNGEFEISYDRVRRLRREVLGPNYDGRLERIYLVGTISTRFKRGIKAATTFEDKQGNNYEIQAVRTDADGNIRPIAVVIKEEQVERAHIYGELIEGETIDTFLESLPHNRQGAEDLRDYIASGADLVYGYTADGLVMRDVKGDNFLIERRAIGSSSSSTFEVHIKERPIANMIDTQHLIEIDDKTAYNNKVGTPLYTAPEVINGLDRSSMRDIYSIGIEAIEEVAIWLGTSLFEIYGLEDDRDNIQNPFFTLIMKRFMTSPEVIKQTLMDLCPEDAKDIIEKVIDFGLALSAMEPTDRPQTNVEAQAILWGNEEPSPAAFLIQNARSQFDHYLRAMKAA